MKIGYNVEGRNDVAFLEGLKERWCPNAELIPVRSRYPKPNRNEMKKLCIDLDSKGADFMVFLNDADTDDEGKWRELLKDYRSRIADQYKHRIIIGLCLRNIECWLCADADWIAGQTGRQPNEFRVPDPKGVLEGALGEDARERIVEIVKNAPLGIWVKRNESFKEFYNNIWDFSKQQECQIEDLH